MSLCDPFLNFAIFAISISIIPTFLYEYEIRDPSEFFLPKISISIIIIGFLIWYFYQYDEDDDFYKIKPYGDNVFYDTKKYKNKKIKINNNSFCQRTDVDTYEKISELYTEKKLKELVETEKFKKMLEEKGDNKKNWNWQSRDRLSGKKQKNESDISSDEIENMTVSDD